MLRRRRGRDEVDVRRECIVRALLELVPSPRATVWDQGCCVDDDLDLRLNVRFCAEVEIVFEEEQDAIVRVSIAGKDRQVVSA